MDEYIGEYRRSADSSTENYFSVIFNCFHKHREALLSIHANGLSHIILSVLNRMFEESVGSSGLQIAERYRRYFHTGGIYNFLLLWLSNGMDEPPDAWYPSRFPAFTETRCQGCWREYAGDNQSQANAITVRQYKQTPVCLTAKRHPR
ncbi:MAG: TetR family transcriptional regulator C-terminal domain-containing protein [Oscillospiraceae bacterium]|jgi:hypothetical protein|nr:TetR family transcriptional regulator C-terminal domain-containing protein [Oscillospiraceae bacterium]